MKKSRFTDEQIIGILREAESGKRIEDICREHKVSNYTIYNWRRKFKGLQVQDARKLKELVANLSLDNLVLKHAHGKK